MDERVARWSFCLRPRELEGGAGTQHGGVPSGVPCCVERPTLQQTHGGQKTTATGYNRRRLDR
ncbi:hypothetical protein GCM10027597_09580 [Saccharopolyspora tripterygii]